MSYIEILRRAEYFKGLNDDELRFVDKICREEYCDAEAIIFHEGDEAKNLYVVKEGKVSIYIEEGQVRPLTVYIVSDGGAFGWSALVKPNRFTAGAKCLEKTNIIVINGAEMRKLCQDNPHLGEIVMENLAYLVSSRLKNMRQQILTQGQPW